MKKMQFIRDLSKKTKPVVKENISYEDALLAKLEKEADTMSDTDKKDKVTFDVPLLIRVFELVREDVKTDMDLHNLVERLLALKDQGTLTMAHYEKIAAAHSGTDSGQMPVDTKTDESVDMFRLLAGIKK
jgi:uncharacterized Zn finger protein